MNKKFNGGVMPAAMTLWNEDETFNAEGQKRYLNWLLEKGVTALSFCGSTGENMTMSIDEQKFIIKTCCEAVDPGVVKYAGTGRYSTLQTIELTKYAKDCGATGAMIINPYYFSPHKRAVLDHFRRIKDAVGDFGIMVYNNPWFAGYELTEREIKMLVEEGVVDSIKCAHGEVDRVHNLKVSCGDTLTIMYGHDYNMIEGLFAGADGILTGSPAVFPKFTRMIYETCAVKKDVDGGREMIARLKPFLDFFYTYKTNDPHWLEIYKYCLNYQIGYAGVPRLPLGAVRPEAAKLIDGILKEMEDLL